MDLCDNAAGLINDANSDAPATTDQLLVVDDAPPLYSLVYDRDVRFFIQFLKKGNGTEATTTFRPFVVVEVSLW